MPLFPPATFYAYAAKNKRIALHTIRQISDCPSDWFQMRMLVEESMSIAFHEHKLTSCPMTLETHLPGKISDHTVGGTRRSQGYADYKLHWQRGMEWFGKVTLNIKSMEVSIDNCQFGPAIWLLSEEYYAEKGIKYRSPSIIPKRMPQLGDVKSLLMDPSPSRYADYSKQPKNPYGSFQDRIEVKECEYSYPSTHGKRTYLPENIFLREEKEKES